MCITNIVHTIAYVIFFFDINVGSLYMLYYFEYEKLYTKAKIGYVVLSLSTLKHMYIIHIEGHI